MDSLFSAVAALVILAGIVFLGCLLGAAGGALAGWIVALVWPHTTAAFLAAIGLGSLQFWQFGLSVGFIGAFFRSSSSSSK